MTIRARLVLVAAVAVVVAVLAAAAASYVAARTSLLGSVDGTLRASAEGTIRSLELRTGQLQRHVGGFGSQFITPSGVVITGGGIPETEEARAVAAGRRPGYYTDVTIDGVPYRELVQGVQVVRVFTGPIYAGQSRAALQVVLPLTSVDRQLALLGTVLLAVAVGCVALALALAWLVGRTALIPLYTLTGAVEEVAATTDVSRRLDPGGPDELGRLRRAFNHLLAALQRSQDAQRQLVLDAGHELRTPLTSLRTNLEVVRRLDEMTPHERSVLVDDLLTQMGELTTLVSDLSELARGEQRHSEPRALRLDAVVEDVVAAARSHGRQRAVAFSLTSAPTWVRGHRGRLARAIGNLCDNALKWSPDGATVEVDCRDGVVSVRDHGPGIALEDLPHIFDRFYRAPAARSMPGSGLGLAIVAQVAQGAGGFVWAGRAEGGGTEFRLHLPVVDPPEDSAVAEEEDQEED